MRVSAGFFVTGLSGNTRIHTLPPRLTCRVMAIRAASIWRAVSHAGLQGLNTEVAEGHVAATLGLAAHPAALLSCGT
jgi:hypothetical protein